MDDIVWVQNQDPQIMRFRTTLTTGFSRISGSPKLIEQDPQLTLEVCSTKPIDLNDIKMIKSQLSDATVNDTGCQLLVMFHESMIQTSVCNLEMLLVICDSAW